MSAHLYAVPDPAPDETPGERPAPVRAVPPLPASAPLPAPADDDHPGPVEGPLDDDQEQHDHEDAPGEQHDDDLQEHQDDEDDPGEQRRRALTLPDLRPYYDVRPLAQLGPLAVEVGKTGGPPLLRFIARELRNVGRMLLWYAGGTIVLARILHGWLSGTIGKKPSVGARLGIAAFVVYALVQTGIQFPAAPWIILGGFLVVLVLASAGVIRVPERKPAKQAAKGKTAKDEKVEKTTKEKVPAKPDDAPAAVEKEDAPAAPRKGLLARLAALRETPDDAPAETPDEAPEEDDDEAPDEDDDGAPEDAGDTPAAPPEDPPAGPPPAPSRDTLIRALHHLYRGGSGVLHTTLRAHLSLPDTRAVKRLLDEAGITYRNGVRSPAGNGPGTHHHDFPPLPPSQGSPQGAGVVAGQPANNNNANIANAPEEGGDRWTAEEIAKGYRFVPDPERGPTAWIIQHHEGR
ncbi:hypothetical protein [Streptomyces sp. 2P-4]|uniref:hypothetical protein n=1 Tax=Streptomyces sp. 2P-4 TaxID=2931974 RepID=UPI00253FAF36|nr:hypothetical protein [Streptomyces sp. 2P-4]